ncbi:uncharacterized protein LOC129819896 isoform X2 [Salvelinus fontinalis]|uniref:uncharacterized protein LOC129819896 isoform X2 n=1 Tax=Salvelinus fontinalis TaxID=8038 RepID=UPI002486B663|nr:uncharacterized protein LOC129819896 isoform X2 [Salvelinus fontinalis]
MNQLGLLLCNKVYLNSQYLRCYVTNVSYFHDISHPPTLYLPPLPLSLPLSLSDEYKGQVYFAAISVLEHLARKPTNTQYPIIGMCLVTLCVCPEGRDTFYLCHSCEEKCGPGQIIDHLLSADHLSNYYSYTDPDVLSFSWMPNMDMLNLIRPLAVKEMDKNGPGVLRVLDMPKSVFVKLKRSGYSKVMQALTQTDRLAECIRADRPERMTIQEYHRDPNRKHPLLGLQHLVEYCCEGHGQRRSYLCQLCRLPVPSRRVIQHTLSFDHLYWYFKVCHPSTLLMKDCYKEYSCRFISMILDLANQAQDISQSANKEIQQVVLEPAVFSSVEFSVYTEALRKLQTIRRDHEGSLKTSITPGDKLEGSLITKDVTMNSVAEAVPMETKSSPEKTYVTPTAVETVATASTAPVVTTATSQRGTCRLHCQDCNVVCESVSQYKLHVRHWEHKKMLGDIFGPGDEDSKACIPSFTLYEYLRNPERTEPIIGVYLLVMCVSTECWKMPFYLCHTCQEIIPANLVMTHLTSTLHLRSTLMYQSPQCLPFGWGTEMGLEVLKTLAWEEERDRGQRENVLKVFDIPDSVFHSIKMSYSSAMKRLKTFHRYLKVDRPLTFSAHLKNKDRRIPLLGLQFLVQYSVTRAGASSPGWGFLCLLCERKLSDGLSIAHIHSYEHVTTFLERAHPGSVKEVKESDERRSEILLDLAQQAEKIHAMGRLQFMMLQRYIRESVSYERALVILKAIKKRLNMGELMPLLSPGKKLVPTSSIRDQSQTTPEPAPASVGEEKQTRKETDNETEMDREDTPETIQMTQETGVEVDKRIGKETCSDPCKGTGRETSKDTGRETSKDTGRETSKDTGRETSKDTGRETSKDTGRETSKDTGRETSKDTGRETSKDTGRETSKDTGRETSKDTITKASQETRKDSRSRGKDEAEKIIKAKEMERNVEKETDKKETSTETVKKLGSKTRNMTVQETGKTTSTETVKKTERETCRAVSIVASRASNRETKRKHAKKPETCKTPEKKTYTQTVKEKTKVTPPPVSLPTTDLWDFLKKQNREAVIGLSALIECHSHGQPPLYLCQVCGCKVFQNCIIVHVTTDCHRLSYLRSLKTVIVPKGNQLHRKLRRAALKLEKTMGYGEAEVMELDAHTYNFVAERSFPIGLNIVMKVINGDPSPDPRLLVSPDPSPKVSPDPSPQVSEVRNPTMTSTALLSYLNASTRTQPVIGVSMLTELPDRHGDYFLCRCCSHRMFTSSLIGHLISARHRYHYIKLVYPEMAADWPVSPELTVKAGPLHEELRVRAAELEAQEGLGQPTVVKREPVAGDTTTTNTEGTAQQSQNSSPPLTVKEEPVDSTVPSQPPRGEKRNKRRSNPVVGVNFLVQVSHRRRKQYYCQLCSVRMKHAIADHMTSLSHRHNYVRLKYPGWTSSPVEMEKKLFKMAVHLEKVDRDAGMGMQKVEVEADEYKELLSFPVEEAVSKLQAIIRRQQEPCDLRHTAPSTNHNPEDLRQTAPLSNSDAAQGLAQGMCGAESRETEGVCPLPVSLSEEENDQTPQRLLVQISVFLGEDQEPLQVPSPFLQDQPSLTSIPLPLSSSIPLSTSLSTVVLSTSPSLSSSIPSHTPSLSTENTTHSSPVSVPVPAPLSALRSSTHLKDWETSLSPEWWERKSPECRETQMLLEIPDRHTLLEYSDRDRQAHLEYSERVRRTDYSERDRQADYSERDRQADYSERDRQADYSERDRQADYSERDRQADYSERDRQADYSERDRQADYSERDRQADYSERDRQADYSERDRQADYSERDRQADYSERDRQADYSERDRQADYSERDRQADYSERDRQADYSERDRQADYSERDRQADYSERDRQADYSERDRQADYSERDRQADYSERDRQADYSERDRQADYSERDRQADYSERDRQADYSERDRQADYSERDRQADYSERDRQADYSERDRQADYSERDRQADYSERDRQADYSERGRQADYSERGRQADYSERGRQADYLRGNRQTEYLASQSLHQTTEHWVTGQVTSMDTMLYSTPTEPDEDQEHTHHHSEHAHQQGEHAHFEQAPASWLSVPQVYLLPDTPAAKRVVGPSHLSKYLKVKGLHNTEPIIGLGSVVECRGISQATFFICVSCAETLSSTHICEHIISAQHQQCYMFSQYSPMRCDWLREQQQPPSPQLLRKVASALSQLEVDLDAQVMLLDQMWYNLVQSAPFYEAMNMLQEQNQNALCLHTASRHQLYPPLGPDPATEQGFDQNHRVMDKLTMDQIEPHQPLQTADTVAGKLTGDQLESGQCIQTADRWPDNQNPDQPQLSQSSERTEPIRDQTPQNHNSEPIRDQTPQNIEPIRAQMPKNSDPIKSQTPQNTEPKRAWMPQNSSEPHLNQDNTVIIKQEPVDPKMEPQTHPQTQPEVDPLKDSLYGHRVQFSPDVQNLAGVCEVEYQGTVLGHSQEVTRIGGATENSLHSTKNLRDSVNNSLPLVGLSAVIECCSEGQVSFYLCVSCGSKIEKTLLISHVLKYRHRQIYLTMRYPWYFLGVVPARGLAEQSRLMQIAKEVEEQNHDEPGTLQEVILAPADFDQIKRMLFDKAVSRLQEICREQNQTELLTMVTSKPEPIVVKQEIVECQVVSHQALGQFLPTQRCRRNTGKRCSNVEGSEVRGQQQLKKRKVSSPPEGHTAPVICLSSPEVTKSSDTHTVNQTHTITPSPTQSNTKPKLTPSCTHSDSQTKLKPSRTHPKPNSTAPEYTRPKLIPHSATKPSGIPADSLTVAKESSSKKPTHTLCKPTHTLSNPPKTLFTSSQKLTDKHSDKNESQKHTEKAKPTRTQSERTHRNRTHTRKHSDLTCTDKAKDRHSDRTKRRHSDRKHTNRHSDHSRSHTLSKRHNHSSSRSSKASPIASPSEPPLLSPYSPAAFSPTRATSAASLSQVKPSQPSCLLNKQLPKQSSQPTNRPPNPTSAVRPLQTQANPPNNTSYPHLHPARTGPSTPPPGPMTPQPPAIPPCLTPPPQPDPVYSSGVKKKTSIVDCDQFVEYFVSLLRSPHFPPALTTPERAESAEAHTRATGPNPGGEEMRGDSKGHAIAIVAALPNLLKRKLSLQEPEDRDPWNYESRQFTPNSKPNPNFQNPNSKPNPDFQNPNPNFQNRNSNPNFQNRNSNPNFQNPNSNPNFQNPNSNHNFQNPNSNPNFQNPNSNPNFQNPNSNSNPNFQSSTPTANATLVQGGYTGGVTVSSSPNPTDPQPPEILPGSTYPGYTYPGYTYPGYTYPGYTYPGSGYAGVVSVSQFNSPINPIPSPSNTQPQAMWSGGNWGTGYPEAGYPGAGYVTTGQAGTSYPGAVSSGSGAGYPGVLLYPEMGYSDMDCRGQAYPRSGTGLGSAGTVMPPGSLYSTTSSPANPSYLALTQPSLDPASYSAWTATVTGVAIETSTAEYLPRPQ